MGKNVEVKKLITKKINRLTRNSGTRKSRSSRQVEDILTVVTNLEGLLHTFLLVFWEISWKTREYYVLSPKKGWEGRAIAKSFW